MENNVVTLETAKQLKAAGFPQETSLFWHRLINHAATSWGDWKIINWKAGSDFAEETVAAATAQEIADQLRQLGRYELKSSNHEKRINAWFWVTDMSGRMFYGFGDNLAEALAAVWLKLQEGK